MDTNKLHTIKESTLNGLRFFVSHRVGPSVQRLFRRLTFGHDGRSHSDFSQTFNFTYVPPYRKVSANNNPPRKDLTANTIDTIKMQQKKALETRVYRWMEAIPLEDELMDPNLYGADSGSDRDREWVRAVSPSTGSGVDQPERSAAVKDAVTDICNGDTQTVVVKDGAHGGGDVPPTRSQFRTLRSINQAALDLPEIGSLGGPVQESITPGVVFRTPSTSSQPRSLRNGDKSKRLSFWKRVTTGKHYSRLP
ncbi:hypothetical protein C7212DRAFT_337876 [Tuber magnatum]|uniref:Uncharacterized protein n=1 Tax=Tuber magnatum TaxID=42249 RepID=A0A317SBT8_9PEZI|nr:hypothetical protein C7212DRAFT_337876 [Tuber magnatum]